MTSTARPGTRRKSLIAAATGALLLTGGGAWIQSGAGADPVDTDIAATCTIGTGRIDVTIPLRVDDKVDPVVAGGHETLETRTGLPDLPAEATIDRMVVTTPIPDQIASVDAVTFSGGNLDGSYEVAGRNLVVTFTGPVSSSAIDVPVVTAEQTVKADGAPTTIEWQAFSSVVADTNYGRATCTPNVPGQVVNRTEVQATSEQPTPTTEPTSTTVPSEPTPTTEPHEPTPTTEPAPTPAPAPAPGDDRGQVGVHASADVEVTAPMPGTPSAPALPRLPSAPSLPVPSPTRPPLPSVPPLPSPPSRPGTPSLPSVPTAPTPPSLPIPSAPTPPTAPTLPTLPALPPLPLPTGSPSPIGVVVHGQIGITLPSLL